jgi:hypothetical protein
MFDKGDALVRRRNAGAVCCDENAGELSNGIAGLGGVEQQRSGSAAANISELLHMKPKRTIINSKR